MTRFLPTVALLGAATLSANLFTAPAMAETRITESVTLTYNIEQLNSQKLVKTVLSDLKRQARKACTTVRPVLNVEAVDSECAADVLYQAVHAIDNTYLNEAYARLDNLKLTAVHGQPGSKG